MQKVKDFFKYCWELVLHVFDVVAHAVNVCVHYVKKGLKKLRRLLGL